MKQRGKKLYKYASFPFLMQSTLKGGFYSSTKLVAFVKTKLTKIEKKLTSNPT